MVGRMGLSAPPASFGPGNITITVSSATAAGGLRGLPLLMAGLAERSFGTLAPAMATIPGGPASYSPNGTIFRLSITDEAGNLITALPGAIQLLMAWTAADLSMAGGQVSALTAAYMVDDNTPAMANPNHEPAGTWIFFSPSAVTVDQANGVMTINTQLVSGIMSVFANPVGYIQIVGRDVALYSSFDPASSQVLSHKAQFAYLQVVEPQVGTRLHVLDPATNGYAYVNASDVGASGAPPG